MQTGTTERHKVIIKKNLIRQNHILVSNRNLIYLHETAIRNIMCSVLIY